MLQTTRVETEEGDGGELLAVMEKTLMSGPYSTASYAQVQATGQDQVQYLTVPVVEAFEQASLVQLDSESAVSDEATSLSSEEVDPHLQKIIDKLIGKAP